MELNQLHYFVAVAETENITKAAKRLFITQPALSRVILRLENELGTSLFDRKGGRLVLNDHGRVFLGHVKPALESINNGVHAVIDGLGSQEIKIFNDLSTTMIQSVAEKCQAEFPNMTFSVINVEDGTVRTNTTPDIVFLPSNSFQDYIFPVSYTERWCVIYNQKYSFHTQFSGKFMTLEQLAQEPLAFYGSDHDRSFLERTFTQAGLSPNLILCESLRESSSQINRCRAVGFVPVLNFCTLITRIEGVPICAAAISDVPCSRQVYLGHSPQFLSNADEYMVLESLTNSLDSEYARINAFYANYFRIP